MSVPERSPGVPRSVTDLAGLPGWSVAVHATSRRWELAEYPGADGADDVLVGLTPVARGLVAMIVWRNGKVEHHRRLPEEQACLSAWRFALGLRPA
ncbi:hypothetical protein [Amycolatopsis panacis]|uniref:Uncharacterized protein n=1 Tax=Amycolatopsis panacis TaxID=2340917 RepID=A0A419I946_9PSEU|nr:hypothetical protein [Amycolatopsis panacis]RJQ89087.1 hypothetical protein D5S19_05300 [Amycolatopsis panacis]